MLFTVIFILLLIGAAVVGSIYSNFLVFYSNFEESQNYNKAYYEAIAALERAELVIKQREPGFVGSGGRKKFNGVSFEHTEGSDKSVSGFSYVSDNPSTNLFWTIDSLTTRIPAKGMGNVDWMMATGDSVDYNMMDYTNSEIVVLYYDKSSGNPYDSGAVIILQSQPTKITGVIRLPGQIRGNFGLLDTGDSLPGNMTSLTDEAVVDWQIQGQTMGGDFTIFARQDVQNQKIKNADSTIRESDLNNVDGVGLGFSGNRIPITTKKNPNNSSGLMVVGTKASDLSFRSFSNIFTDSSYTGIQLKLSLLNELRTKKEGDNYKTYPFLEYYLDFGEKKVPDKFYTINAEGKYGDFQINLLVKKPTIKQSVLGSFTVIF